MLQQQGRRSKLRVVDGGAERLLSVKEVAERLNVSTATVYALIASGEIAHVRVSNAIRITFAAVRAYASRRR